MAGISTPIYHREKFIPVQGICTTRRACVARALWGKYNGRVTRATKNFLTGVLTIGTCQAGPYAVSRCTAALRSPCDRQSAGTTVNVQMINHCCRQGTVLFFPMYFDPFMNCGTQFYGIRQFLVSRLGKALYRSPDTTKTCIYLHA